MMSRHALTMVLASIALIPIATLADELKVEPDPENVVASRLEGKWQTHTSLTQQLTGNAKSRTKTLSFKSDPSVAAKVPDKYTKFFTENKMKVYLAGVLNLDGNDYPFVLTLYRGNPHVAYFRERDGDPFGDSESFNVMLAVAEADQNDLLFVGGDFNNQAFAAFERTKPDK